MTRLLASTLLLALGAAACGDDDITPEPTPEPEPEPPGATIQLAGIDARSVLGGEQTTHITATSELGVVRVELFLDTMRIGASEFAPFEVAWTTTDFVEGQHQLTARAHLGDGRHVDRSLPIQLDNTAPSISWLGSVERGTLVDLPVHDNHRIARVELTGAVYATLTEGPFRVEWTAGCGYGAVTVVVTDGAGWTTTQELYVQTSDPADLDCDQHRSVAHGGNDCDDQNGDVNPDRYDGGDNGADVNCDGAIGTDYDRDGAASTSTGGSDCQDYDAAAHGPLTTWTSTYLGTVLGTAPRRFARTAEGAGELHVLPLGWSRSLRHQRFDLAGTALSDVAIADGVDAAGDLYVDGDALLVPYRQGGSLYLATWTGGTWSSERIASNTGTLGGIVVERDRDGLVVVVAGSEGTVLHRDTATGWSTVPLFGATAGAPTALVIEAASQVVAVRWSGTIRKIGYAGDAPVVTSWDTYAPGRPVIMGGVVSYLASAYQWGSVYMVRDGLYQYYTGAAYDLARGRLPFGEALLELGSSRRFIDGNGAAVWSGFGRYGSLTDAGASSGLEAVYAADGYLYFVGSARAPATEVVGDGYDSDCDGSYDS